MKRKIILTFILFAGPIVFSEDNPFCSLPSCPNRSHTLCKYPRQKIANNCEPLTDIGLDREEVAELLRLHNYFRDQPIFNQEGETSSEVPNSRRHSLEWDHALADSAQRWSEQCNNVLDECRNDHRFNVSQRVSLYEKKKKYKRKPALYSAVLDWYREWYREEGLEYDEDCQTSRSAKNCFKVDANQPIHRVWGNATKFGCGALRTADGTYYYLYLVCNYAPMNEIRQLRLEV